MLYLEVNSDRNRRRRSSALWRRIAIHGLIALQIIGSACNDLEKPKPEPYYSGTTPTRKQEFRWSNGKPPKSMDPARAVAPPETDLVRAVYEGLTDLDAKTLTEKPAAAESWTAGDDFRTWTFHLRSDARWTNGKPLVAQDFVRSWKRLGEIGDAIAHRDLLKNIVGFPIKRKETVAPTSELLQSVNRQVGLEPSPSPQTRQQSTAQNSTVPTEVGPALPLFGLSAPDARTLRVLLIAPDKDFAKLVAHPLFRPIFDAGMDLGDRQPGPGVVTNGAFNIAEVSAAGITLERSQTYWNREAIKLERVQFVSTENAEQALKAYKSGEIDAVTNADFEPLALKLLEPFEDFRRWTHAAINFYEINHEKPPFDDRRVREALAISIERERLTEGEMEGFTQPAWSFLPFGEDSEVKIIQDKDKAAELLEEAGFPGGKDFPVIRLVVNRNETQQRVAKAVARMWKQNLNLETEIVVKENAEIELARNDGDFDLIRRGAVFPTADELMGILTILKPPQRPSEPKPGGTNEIGVEALDPQSDAAHKLFERPAVESPDVTMSEANAVYELWAVPLYFPTSYSLVKPYVSGFEMNSLDAPALNDVSIDADWQPK
ncbi:MAG TPA: peptide ABC transporter substrate-binding protein [Pyrinomonadaceae bacterium]|nr:peptide ABC transporter substrate-binding protein [Pyrinomonadaceae bacterium]